MPCQRCSLCGISFPEHIETCPACGEETSYFNNSTFEADWREKVARVKDARDGNVLDATTVKIAHNKCERYVRAGLDIDRAMILAGDRDADLTLFERLAGDPKCGVDTAFDIVRSR